MPGPHGNAPGGDRMLIDGSVIPTDGDTVEYHESDGLWHPVAAPSGTTVTVEDDADGQRIALKNHAGATIGYVGFSAGAGDAIALWLGDGAGAADYDSPAIWLYAEGGAAVSNAAGQGLSISAAGHISLIGGPGQSVGLQSDGGISIVQVDENGVNVAAAAVGFFGKSPVARPAAPVTLGDVIAALQALGLVAT